MFGYANPQKFMGLSDWLVKPVWALALVTLAVGLFGAFFIAPADYQQGETVRIMYIHVPSAWMAMFCYATIAVASLISLIWRHNLADVAAKSAAPIGAVFTFLALFTGALWGKPMWGTYWVWDARLTSVLVLFFVYLGYIALWEAIEDEQKASKAAAVLALVGAVNLPIIKFSVDWWNTLHQPASVLRLDGPTIHSSMLWPLLVMAVAYMLLFAGMMLTRMRTEIRRKQLRRLERRALAKAASGGAVMSGPSSEPSGGPSGGLVTSSRETSDG